MLPTKLAVVLLPMALLICSFPAHAQNPINAFEAASTSIDGLLKPNFSNSAEFRTSVVNPQTAPKQIGAKPFSTIALGFKASTLGAGLELATPLSRSLNLRAGANIVVFGYAFSIDGVDYHSDLRFRSAQASLDWFPSHRSFHISPGILYTRNSLLAVANVPPGQSFVLGNQPLINSINDPIGGTASVVFPRNFAPTLLVGFGNMIPRTGNHFSFPIELGAAFTGRPQINLNLSGTACTIDGCFGAATGSIMQTALQKEIVKLNHYVRWFPVYPIAAAGVAYRF
jgi:hypothetical protein